MPVVGTDPIQTSALKKKGLRPDEHLGVGVAHDSNVRPEEEGIKTRPTRAPPRPRHSNVRPMDSRFRGNDGLKETIHLSFIRNQVGRCAVLHPRDVRPVFPPGMNPSSFPGRSARTALSARQWSTARISKGPDTDGSLVAGCLPVVFMSARCFSLAAGRRRHGRRRGGRRKRRWRGSRGPRAADPGPRTGVRRPPGCRASRRRRWSRSPRGDGPPTAPPLHPFRPARSRNPGRTFGTSG